MSIVNWLKGLSIKQSGQVPPLRSPTEPPVSGKQSAATTTESLPVVHTRDFTGKSLGQRQRMFTLMVAELIQYAYKNGYELTLGDAFRDPRVHGAVGVKNSYSSANSVHKERLAIDLNLFINGAYQTSTEAHKELGEYWKSMGGSWGGDFTNPDGNHYSIEYKGRK